jgi:uncharacterized protein (DUF1015 family)
MADILPFAGVRYDAARLGVPLEALVAPPYDVIPPDEQAELYDRHPSNVVRLILGREEDKYVRAGALFRQWLSDGTLVTDAEPCVYAYRQSFQDPLTGQTAPERIGLVCLLKLEEYGSGAVLPHENTLTGAKADRLSLLRATGAQFESIYGLYSDPDGAVQSFLSEYDDREPVLEHVDDFIGSSHAVERINDPSAIMVLRELLKDKPVFIADGHHRYETALNYRREVRAAHPEWEGIAIAADYILITLTAFEDEGLLVLPTHRLVRDVDPDRISRLPEALASEFVVTPATAASLEADIEEASRQGRIAFGLVFPQGSFLATLNVSPGALVSLVPGPQTDAVKRLPVTLLHSLILDRQLGIGAAALAAATQVSYTRDAADAVLRVVSGEYQAAFLLPRPSVQDVRDVSLAGDTMPQKSTFFFPKLLSGLLLRDLEVGAPTAILGPEERTL